MKHAIIQTPSSSFAEGLTTAGLGAPNVNLALEQHARYGRALEACGLEVTRLDPDTRHPDSCFVEDAAIVTERGFHLTRPGAPSRRGEVEGMARVLARLQEGVPKIEAPGTLDGGDVCRAGDHFWIGISQRTNVEGAGQLGAWLKTLGYTCEQVDLRETRLLHLKSGMAYLGARRLAVVSRLRDHAAFRGYDLVLLPENESYAANCLEINGRVLIAAGHPVFEARLLDLGYAPRTLDMSEFQKMDGGLSCLSLRW